VDKNKRLLDLACRIGEAQAQRANLHAVQARLLRNAIRRAIVKLRAGQAGRALQILENHSNRKDEK
jgi:hypothetical protein